MSEPVRAAERRRSPSCSTRRACASGSQRQRWYASKSRSVAGIEIVESVVAAARTRCCCWRSSRRASRPARTSSTSCRWRSAPRATRPTATAPLAPSRSRESRTATCTTRSPTPRRRVELLRRIAAGDEIETDEGRFSFQRVDGVVDAAGDGAGPPDGRRAVELVGRVRRPARAQGVPQARARHQPRARDAALPHRPRVRAHRAAPGLVRLRRPGARRDARRRCRRSCPTRSTAGSWRSTRSPRGPEVFLDRLGEPR